MTLYNDVDLHAFVDGQVGPDRRTAITSFLEGAPDSAARVETWRRQNASIKTMFGPAANEPVPLWLTVGQIATGRTEAARLPERQPKVVRSRRALGRLPQAGGTIIALAFAAGLVVALGADRLVQWSGLVATTPAIAAQGFQSRAWEAHETYGLDPDRPIDVSDVTPGGVETWLNSRVPFHARVPNLRAEGWTLLGGRVAPNDAGPGALLVYRNPAGDRLSLFSGRIAEGAVNTTPSAAATHGILSWADDRIGYAVLTSKDKAWLDAHATALKTAVAATDPSDD